MASIGAYCKPIFRLQASLSVISTSATSFLFLARVRAVYEKSRVITVIFGAFWLAIVVSSCNILRLANEVVCSVRSHPSIPMNLNSVSIKFPIGSRCGLSRVPHGTFAFLWVKTAYQTAVFAAISYRMLKLSEAQSWPPFPFCLFAQRHKMSRFTQDVLCDGQLFYL